MFLPDRTDDEEEEEEDEEEVIASSSLTVLLTPDMEHFDRIVKYLPNVDRYNLAEAFIGYGAEVYGYLYHLGLPRDLCPDSHTVRYQFATVRVKYDAKRKGEWQVHSFCICRNCLFDLHMQKNGICIKYIM